MTTINERRALVHDLKAQGHTLSEIVDGVAAAGVVNPKTNAPYSLGTIRNDLWLQAGSNGNAPKTALVSEMIGRAGYGGNSLWQQRYTATRSIDETRPDYAFWDKFRRADAVGYKLAGVLAEPIASTVASWVLGDGVGAQLEADQDDDADPETDDIAYTNDILDRFMMRYRATFAQMLMDAYSLGDQFIVVNPDGSLSVPSPETVDLELDALDYRTLARVTVRSMLPKATIEDEYTDKKRTLKVTRTETRSNGRTTLSRQRTDTAATYRVTAGRIPVVHIPNDRSANEVYGRPIFEALLHLFERYDAILEKALDAGELLGNPIPVFEGMENVQETIEANSVSGDETYYDEYGDPQTRLMIDWDALTALVIGKGGAFKFAAPPGGYTGDIRTLLQVLFLLILQHTRIPEYMWGGEMGSARASTDNQLAPFTKYIEYKRLQLAGQGTDELLGSEARGGLLAVCDLFLRQRSIVDPRIVVGPVKLLWDDLGEADMELTRKWVELLHGRGLITDQDAVEQSGLFGNPAEVVRKAHEQADEQEEAYNERQAQAAAQQTGFQPGGIDETPPMDDNSTDVQNSG